MIKQLLLLLSLLCSSTMIAQERLTWTTFERLEFEEVYDAPSATWLQQPKWTADLRSWDGRAVKITGYVIGLDTESNEYALSAFPFASCFFCGAAGPETVLELVLKIPQVFTTDDVVTFSGTLRLNTDPLKFPLTLEDAVVR